MEYIKDNYDSELINYKYCEEDNIKDIPKGSHIKYISKCNLTKKSGFFRTSTNDSIIQLYFMNRKWYIYTNKYYIFYKTKDHNSLKNILKELVENDFAMNSRK